MNSDAAPPGADPRLQGIFPNTMNLQGKDLTGFTGLAKGSPFFAKRGLGDGGGTGAKIIGTTGTEGTKRRAGTAGPV